jgi:hypothetical protein
LQDLLFRVTIPEPKNGIFVYLFFGKIPFKYLSFSSKNSLGRIWSQKLGLFVKQKVLAQVSVRTMLGF